jgi:hypothetical protein
MSIRAGASATRVPSTLVITSFGKTPWQQHVLINELVSPKNFDTTRLMGRYRSALSTMAD